MATRARSRRLYSQFLFTVHDMSSGFQTSKFQKASGLKMTIAHAEYAEGGAMANIKEPARAKFGDVTLTRGVSDDESFYHWCRESVDMQLHVPEGAGVLTEDLLRNLCIYQNNRRQQPVIKWPLYSCSPADWTPSTWDNMSDEIQIEELVISLWYFDRETQ
jgi:phage tail-like protein